MNFERGRDPKETMEIGIHKKYEKVLNDVGYTYYGRILDPDNWEEIEIYIEKKMEWPRGTVTISKLEGKNGVHIHVKAKKIGL